VPVACAQVEVRRSRVLHHLDDHVDVETGIHEGVDVHLPGFGAHAFAGEGFDHSVDGLETGHMVPFKGGQRDDAGVIFHLDNAADAAVFHRLLHLLDGSLFLEGEGDA